MSEILQGEKESVINAIKQTLMPPINGVDDLTLWLESSLYPVGMKNTLHSEPKEYFRLFKHGQTEAVIRLHTNQQLLQIKIWYADLVRRSAPEIVKNTIRSFFNIFFNDVFKPNEPPFFDLYQKEKHHLLEKTFFVNNEVLPADREFFVIQRLLQEKPQPGAIHGITGLYQPAKLMTRQSLDELLPDNANTKILLKNK